MLGSAYRSTDPLRPVDWRVRIAEDLVDRDRALLPGGHDHLTAEAVRFLRWERCCRSQVDRRRLRNRMPDLAAAFEVWRNLGGTARSVLEARVLADEPVQEIAKRIGLGPQAVASYEGVFFDVRDRLHCVDLILHEVIGLYGLDARERLEYGKVWKLLAYLGGTAALESVTLSGWTGGRLSSLSELLPALSASARTVLHGRMAAAVPMLPGCNPRTAGQMVKLFDELDAKVPENVIPPSRMEREVASLTRYKESVGVPFPSLTLRSQVSTTDSPNNAALPCLSAGS